MAGKSPVPERKKLLIIGAGPYGLAAAAYAKHSGIDFTILGEPMGFWKRHMPRGLILRSGLDWHLDPFGIHTLDAFLQERRIPKASAEPIPVELFLEYAQWFQACKSIEVQQTFVTELSRKDDWFEAKLESGERLYAQKVVVAAGFRPFLNIPEDLVQALPPNRYSHTCSLVDFESLRDRCCLIIGGRQSAFEWAALIHEGGAAAVHICYRHLTPRFEKSDWTWIDPMMEETLRTRGWFRRLAAKEQEAIHQRLWAEGRLKLEPWLEPRVRKDSIKLWPNSRVASCHVGSDGTITVRLDTGTTLLVDHIILATGYRVNMRNVCYLSKETVLASLRLNEGFPALDEDFQSSIPGLFFPSLPSTRDFGPFFGFVRGCPVVARIIIDKLTREN